MYKHVLIHWLDAGSECVYIPPEAAEKLSCWDTYTVGWLYFEDEKRINVAQEYHENENGDILLRECKSIPRISVAGIYLITGTVSYVRSSNFSDTDCTGDE